MNKLQIQTRVEEILRQFNSIKFIYSEKNALLMDELKQLQAICDHEGQEKVCKYCNKEL